MRKTQMAADPFKNNEALDALSRRNSGVAPLLQAIGKAVRRASIRLEDKISADASISKRFGDGRVGASAVYDSTIDELVVDMRQVERQNPHEWMMYYDDFGGRRYWVHNITQRLRWSRPRRAKAALTSTRTQSGSGRGGARPHTLSAKLSPTTGLSYQDIKAKAAEKAGGNGGRKGKGQSSKYTFSEEDVEKSKRIVTMHEARGGRRDLLTSRSTDYTLAEVVTGITSNLLISEIEYGADDVRRIADRAPPSPDERGSPHPHAIAQYETDMAPKRRLSRQASLPDSIMTSRGIDARPALSKEGNLQASPARFASSPARAASSRLAKVAGAHTVDVNGIETITIVTSARLGLSLGIDPITFALIVTGKRPSGAIEQEFPGVLRIGDTLLAVGQTMLPSSFETVDTDGDGTIDADELMSAFERLHQPIDHYEAVAMIATYDKDNDGTIDLNEFRTLVRERLLNAVERAIASTERPLDVRFQHPLRRSSVRMSPSRASRSMSPLRNARTTNVTVDAADASPAAPFPASASPGTAERLREWDARVGLSAERRRVAETPPNSVSSERGRQPRPQWSMPAKRPSPIRNVVEEPESPDTPGHIQRVERHVGL